MSAPHMQLSSSSSKSTGNTTYSQRTGGVSGRHNARQKPASLPQAKRFPHQLDDGPCRSPRPRVVMLLFSATGSSSPRQNACEFLTVGILRGRALKRRMMGLHMRSSYRGPHALYRAVPGQGFGSWTPADSLRPSFVRPLSSHSLN